MKLGVHLTAFDATPGAGSLGRQLTDIGQAVETAGVSQLSVMDHFFQMEMLGGPEQPMLEAYTTLGHLAASTTTVRLGALVTGVTYRHPGLLAKMVATLDHLSGGRASLGIGAAWYEREHTGLGVPFPPLAERFERLEETVRICRQMWDPTDDGPFQGRHYQLAETRCVPGPVSTPEILIGGEGERKTLRLVARYADACNLNATSREGLVHKLDVLKRHCDDAGRDVGEIRVTLTAGLPLYTGDVDGFVTEIAGYTGLGIDTVIVSPPAAYPARWIEEHAACARERIEALT